METAMRSDEAKYECLLFDMDDTLYPMSVGINFACRKNIEEFMLYRLGIDESEVPRMCLELYKEFGTTMAGLKDLGYEFDNEEFHGYVHGKLPYQTLKPDPQLRSLLLSMPQRKIIFTNADKTHAAQVLRRLGLEDCFEGVICFETLNSTLDSVDSLSWSWTDDSSVDRDGEAESWVTGETKSNTMKFKPQPQVVCKPSLLAFEAAIRIANVDPKKTIFFDDSARNIATAKSAGLQTVIVGSSNLVPGADHALSNIHNIKEAVPEIWEDEEELMEQMIKSAVETVVLA